MKTNKMKIEEIALKLGELSFRQLVELNSKSMIYGIVYFIKDKDENIDILINKKIEE